jgi:hypothetical protein
MFAPISIEFDDTLCNITVDDSYKFRRLAEVIDGMAGLGRRWGSLK